MIKGSDGGATTSSKATPKKALSKKNTRQSYKELTEDDKRKLRAVLQEIRKMLE